MILYNRRQLLQTHTSSVVQQFLPTVQVIYNELNYILKINLIFFHEKAAVLFFDMNEISSSNRTFLMFGSNGYLPNIIHISLNKQMKL